MSPHPRAVKFLERTIECPPPHPFRFRWQIPCVGVKAANRAQLRIDSGLTPVGPIIAVEELRIIGDLPTPSLPTREIAGTRRHPQHRHPAVCIWTDEVPLPPPEMARTSHQDDPLVELPDLYSKPSFVPTAHVCRDDAGSHFLVEIAIRPPDADRPGGCAWPNKSTSSCSIDATATRGRLGRSFGNWPPVDTTHSATTDRGRYRCAFDFIECPHVRV